MQGIPTEEETVAEFRALYLHSRNASKCARKLEIDERTGRRIAERLEEEPGFSEDVRKLRARYLDRLTALRMDVAETAHDRYHEELHIPEPTERGVPVIVVDKRAEHGRLVLDAEKNAQALAKFESESSTPDKPSEVLIRIVAAKLPGDPEGDGGGSAAA